MPLLPGDVPSRQGIQDAIDEATHLLPTMTEAMASINLTTNNTLNAWVDDPALPGLAFTASRTRRVMVLTSAYLRVSTTGGILLGAQIRAGSAIGSGALVVSSTYLDGAGNYNTAFVRSQGVYIFDGLTQGSTYNVKAAYYNAGSGGNHVHGARIRVVHF